MSIPGVYTLRWVGPAAAAAGLVGSEGAEDLHKVDIWAEHNPVYQYLLAYIHLKAFGVENADKYSVLGIWNNF